MWAWLLYQLAAQPRQAYKSNEYKKTISFVSFLRLQPVQDALCIDVAGAVVLSGGGMGEIVFWLIETNQYSKTILFGIDIFHEKISVLFCFDPIKVAFSLY